MRGPRFALDFHPMGNIEMSNVREYAEGYPVVLNDERDRLTISALDEYGYNGTAVDLLDVIAWVKANRPELLLP